MMAIISLIYMTNISVIIISILIVIVTITHYHYYYYYYHPYHYLSLTTLILFLKGLGFYILKAVFCLFPLSNIAIVPNISSFVSASSRCLSLSSIIIIIINVIVIRVFVVVTNISTIVIIIFIIYHDHSHHFLYQYHLSQAARGPYTQPNYQPRILCLYFFQNQFTSCLSCVKKRTPDRLYLHNTQKPSV